MASIKTTQMNGDLSLGRDIATGGKARIAGSATIGHNLKVNGWLEAPNIKGVTKGIFKTLAELNAAYPEPEDGWLAGVGTSSPFTAYIAKDGSWVATGGTIATTIDVPGLENGLQELQTSVNAVVAEATEVIQQGVEDINEIKAELLAENAELFNAAVESINPTTVIEGDVENAADEEDLTSVEVSGAEVLKFKDKTYSPLTYSGMGRVHLRKNMVSSTAGGVTVVKNVLTQDMLYKGEAGSRVPNTNTVFEVQYDYDLNGATINLPEKSTLQFTGGSLTNGTITGAETVISDSMSPMFGPDMVFRGTFMVDFVRPEWFKLETDLDDTASIQRAYDFLYQTHSSDAAYRKNIIKFLNKTYVVSPNHVTYRPADRTAENNNHSSDGRVPGSGVTWDEVTAARDDEDTVRCCLYFRLANGLTLEGCDRTIIKMNYSDPALPSVRPDVYMFFLDIYDNCIFRNMTFIGKEDFVRGYNVEGRTISDAVAELGHRNFIGVQTAGGGRKLTLEHLKVEKFNIGIDFSYNNRYRPRWPVNNGANGDTNIIDNVTFQDLNYGIYIVSNTQITASKISNSTFGGVYCASIASTSYMTWTFSNLSITSPSPFLRTITYDPTEAETAINKYGRAVAYTYGNSQNVLFLGCKWEYNLNEWSLLQGNDVALVKQDSNHGRLNVTFVNCALDGGSPNFTKVCMYLGYDAKIVFIAGRYYSKISLGKSSSSVTPGLLFIGLRDSLDDKIEYDDDTEGNENYVITYVG